MLMSLYVKKNMFLLSFLTKSKYTQIETNEFSILNRIICVLK